MNWFNSKEKKKKMEFIQNYVPTSKAQLLQVAMMMNRGDIQKAQEFFDFYSKNLNLPDFDPIAPTFMQQMKGGASELYAWIKENQTDLMQGYQFIHSIIKNHGALPDIAPSEAPTAPLPDINK